MRGVAGRLATAFIDSKLTLLVIFASILLGIGSVQMLPREEEPQIVVPIIDVFVEMPGASPREVEERVTRPMEKLIWEIPGVEYVYSTASPGRNFTVVRFRVGEDEEDAIVRLNQKLQANFDLIPPGASHPLVKPRSIDDVPILSLTLWSEQENHFTLRRVAAELHDQIKQIPDVSEVKIIGGARRQLRAVLDTGLLASRGLSVPIVAELLGRNNLGSISGSFSQSNREVLIETRSLLETPEDASRLVVGVWNSRPVYLSDVARIEDGSQEPSNYVFHTVGGRTSPAVTLSVSKRKGTNATLLAEQVIEKVERLRGRVIPSNIQLTVTRNYGETAREKSDELLLHMLIAIVSVSLLIWLTLGLRESGIVAVAIPVTLALTLVVFYLYGYTLNRVTLFALIFSIGILVDDAIVVVENIVRHYRLPSNLGRSLVDVAIEAVDEVGNPTILATFAVIAAILPMAFVRGLMGPYMRPIPVGASAAMVFSLLVAFVVTPWASLKLLKNESEGHHESTSESRSTRLYRKVMRPLIEKRVWRTAFLVAVVGLLLASTSLVALRLVMVKMLPFDNKSEFQVIIDMPEGSTLEETAAAAREMGAYVATVAEVSHFQTYVGTASPYNFNGLVRHYFLRTGPNVADLQVNLRPRSERSKQSHDLAKQMRPELQRIAKRFRANVKVAEVPPGPPVLQTLVAEIYGPDAEQRLALARQVKEIFEKTEDVVDVDWYVEDEQEKYSLEIDQEKAALSGISPAQAVHSLQIALGGMQVGLLHQPSEKEDLPILLRLDITERSDLQKLLSLRLTGSSGQNVALGELVKVHKGIEDRSIYHKNLMNVVYVTADVAGRAESPVYAILKLSESISQLKTPEGYTIEQHTAAQPETNDYLAIKWDGEWHITYEVFRDLGLAFAAVLILIYVLTVGWFQSFKTPLVIMAAIPFSLVGILPAHWLMGAFFTATSMIGFIAGAGIVVRNSIILVDFIELRLKEGMPLADAVIDAGAVRFRPMLLTAAAVIVGASVILFDPIFQGLALALMAGEVASLLLSRLTVPILYYLSKR